MEKVEYSVCEDCMLYVAYGESETLSTEESNWTAQRMRDEIDFRDAHFVNGIQPTEDDPEGAGFDEFSHSQCELCMDSRSGSRHGVTLIIQEKGHGQEPD